MIRTALLACVIALTGTCAALPASGVTGTVKHGTLPTIVTEKVPQPLVVKVLPGPAPSESDVAEAKAEREELRSQARSKELSDWILAIFTVVLAGATIVLTIATFRLARDGKLQSEAHLKAYLEVSVGEFSVAVNSSWLQGSLWPVDPMQAYFDLTNRGITPARKVKVWLGYIGCPITMSGPPEAYFQIDLSQPPAAAFDVTNPGTSKRLRFHMDADQLTLAVNAAKKVADLYVFGFVEFVDVFGKRELFSFCRRFSPGRGGNLQGFTYADFEPLAINHATKK